MMGWLMMKPGECSTGDAGGCPVGVVGVAGVVGLDGAAENGGAGAAAIGVDGGFVGAIDDDGVGGTKPPSSMGSRTEFCGIAAKKTMELFHPPFCGIASPAHPEKLGSEYHMAGIAW